MLGFLFTVTLPTWIAITWRKLAVAGVSRVERRKAPRSIVVIRLDQLGDVVLTTGLFRELKRHYPEARVTAVVPEPFTPLLATNRNVDEIVALRIGGARWLPASLRQLASVLSLYRARLRHRRFDLAISPRWDVDESLATLLCLLVNAMRRAGYTSQTTRAKARLNFGFDAAFDLVAPPGELLHEADRSVRVLRALGCEPESARPEVFVTESDRDFATAHLSQHHEEELLVALGVGARAPGRRWPLDRYADLIHALNQHRQIVPVIVCALEEKAEAEALASKLAIRPYIFCGLPLRSTCAVLERCDLFVGNDSGPAHLAAAVNCPTLVVSRHPIDGDVLHPNGPARFAPRGARVKIVQPKSGSDGCDGFCRETAPHCILQVTVAEVACTARALLAERAAGNEREPGRTPDWPAGSSEDAVTRAVEQGR
jgi:heptosyltransferase-2